MLRNALKIPSGLKNNETGAVSWTAVGVAVSIVWFFVVHITIFIYAFFLKYELSAGILQWSLSVTAQLMGALLVRGVRDVARYWGTDFISEAGSVLKKKDNTTSVSESNNKRATAKPQAAKAPVKSNSHQITGGNFQLHEFDSKDGAAMPAKAKLNLLRLIKNLEVIRAELGNRPIIIASGYRSPAHNAAINGAKNSQHMQGLAADFKVQGLRPAAVAKKIKALMDEGKIEPGGLKAYASWVHYDIRGEYVTW